MTKTIEEKTLDEKYEQFARAMFLESGPVNPQPFAKALYDYLAEGGKADSNTFQAILWTLLSMHYGSFRVIKLAHALQQAFTSVALAFAAAAYPDLAQEELNMHSEFIRLDDAFNGEPVEDEEDEDGEAS
jgi:hypothetical protein